MNVMCILTDGFEELEAVGTIALLRRAGIRIDVYAIDHTAATGRFDITISNLADVKDVNRQTMICCFCRAVRIIRSWKPMNVCFPF